MPSPQQQRYWLELAQLKAHACYLGLYHSHLDKHERRLNYFLAFSSNGSIAAWAVWKSVDWIWASIIALSQLVNALRPHLPLTKIKKQVARASVAFDQLFIEAESDWFGVAQGHLTEEELHKLTTKLKLKKQDLVSRAFDDNTLPEKSDLLVRARSETERYFATNYDE